MSKEETGFDAKAAPMKLGPATPFAPGIIAGAILALTVVLAPECGIVSPATAGVWITGSTYDLKRGVAMGFRRYLADDGEGQMTVRCDYQTGLWIDAGVTGNAEIPEGLAPTLTAPATFTFVHDHSEQTVSAEGSIVFRPDGAVVVSITGNEATPVGRLLLEPAERLDITIGATTRPVSLVGEAEQLQDLADRCHAWPK